MIQYLIIAAIVVWALLYSAWSLMPAGGRRALADRAAGWASYCGLGEKQVQALNDRLAQQGSCGACSTCAGCGKPAPPAPRVNPGDKDAGAN
jgi:hypothetical protein